MRVAMAIRRDVASRAVVAMQAGIVLVAMLASTAIAAAMLASTAFAAPPDWKIAIEPAAQIKANYPTDMRIRVTDVKGQPVTGASVEYVVTMTDMDHGEHKSTATMTAPGVYEGKVNFFMVGPWALDVRIKRGTDATSQKKLFDIKG